MQSETIHSQRPSSTDKVLIYDLSLAELKTHFETLGQPPYRAQQVWQGLYQQFWDQPQQFTNLPADLRKQLAEAFTFSSLKPEKILKSSDGETIKTLFSLPDGRLIEAVLMRYESRRTLCISSQAGCAMGCVFCATGQMGFKRNLTSGEIVEQVMYYARQLQAEGEKVTNIVVMGMGEPFHNYDHTLAAIDRLNDPLGMKLGERRFTISTVGIIPMIRRFADEKRQVNLAISLHATTDEQRSAMMPVNRKYPVHDLLNAAREYTEKTGRRITFEWALIQDVNDSVEDARALSRLLHGMLCHVNVIPLNPTRKFAGKATTRQRAEAFRAEMEHNGIPCSIRLRRGIDIQAGCGQLAAENAKE
jgi:23S rRNA (adenine2503-C2)-methyltransferase